MNNLPMLRADKPTTVSIATLVEHVLLRATQLGFPLTNFTEDTVVDWVSENFNNELWKNQGMCSLGDDLTQRGCMFVSNTLPDSLMALVQLDILVLFQGHSQVYQMVNSTQQHPELTNESTGPFQGLSFNPPGDTELHIFPNGTRKISSLYLAAVSEELFKQGQLDGKNPRRHDNLVKKIRETVVGLKRSYNSRNVLGYTYFDSEEGSYRADKHNPSTNHIWMSPDLALLVAASEHLSIRARIIDDLNRLQHIVQTRTNVILPPPSIPAYLPDTIESVYREKGMMDILSCESSGCYAVSRVKRMWESQFTAQEGIFEDQYPAIHIYPELHRIVQILELDVLQSTSPTGGKVKMYPLEALKAVFVDVDFSTL